MLVVRDRKSTRLNSSHTVIYTLSLHDALPIYLFRIARVLGHLIVGQVGLVEDFTMPLLDSGDAGRERSEEHTSELQSHSDLHSFPTRRSSDLSLSNRPCTRSLDRRPGRSCRGFHDAIA